MQTTVKGSEERVSANEEEMKRMKEREEQFYGVLQEKKGEAAELAVHYQNLVRRIALLLQHNGVQL